MHTRSFLTTGCAIILLAAGCTRVVTPTQTRATSLPKSVQVHGKRVGQKNDPSPFRSYTVNKEVSGLPQNDLSTPESAYAAINQLIINGGNEEEWSRVDYRRSTGLHTKRSEREEADMYRAAIVREVSIYKGRLALVLAEVKIPAGQTEFDQRMLILIDGRWRNYGHSGTTAKIDEARFSFVRKSRVLYRNAMKELGEADPEVPKRQPIADPDAYLKPYVDFLRAKGEAPRAFALNAMASHKLTIMCEVHHRPLYWRFDASLVESPKFAKAIGTIYMELPSNDQDLMDRFLSSDKLNPRLAMDVLRDMMWMGWPDQPMLDFLITVWKTNQKLAPAARLRVVLVDMQRPWQQVSRKEDWGKYEVDRDRYMADSILRDLRTHPAEKRNALFIVGHGHVKLNMKMADGKPLNLDAGSYLRQALGAEAVFAFFPHKPVATNDGEVGGRLCLGLFDSAFLALGNKPLAFPLTEGPFGDQPYDAEPDNPAAIGKYGEAYSAYLYLGPLENEPFSPLIPGFYNEAFAKEIERRTRILHGKPWHEEYGYASTNPRDLIEWMSGKNGSWGRPRKWTKDLGPINAWVKGDDWDTIMRDEKHREALQSPSEITAAASQLLAKIQRADYSSLENFRQSAWDDLNYVAYTRADILCKWMYEHFRNNPIQSVELGSVSCTAPAPELQQYGRLTPVVHYKLKLKRGSVLEGDLRFYFMPRTGIWQGFQGLDWHLRETKA